MTESLLPTCTVWIDGVRMADGCILDEIDTDPVVLTGLKVVWGRDNTIDQPEPGTAVFDVLDVGGGVRFVDVLHIGSKVEIRAEATIYPDPTIPVFTYDAGFEGMAVDSTPPSSATNTVVTVSAGGPPRTGIRSARIVASAYNTGPGSVIFPPGPFSASASAWDAIPRTFQGQTWQYGMSVLATQLFGFAQTVRVRPVAFTAPNAASATVLTSFTLTAPYGTVGWSDLLSDFEPPEGVWLGLQVEITPAGGAQWDQVPADVTWDSVDPALQWDAIGGVYVDNLKILAPATGALRVGTIFTGRITDMEASYDLDMGGTLVKCIAQTHLAELDNRYVGDVPWLAEPLANRFKRIVDASGQTINYQIDSSVQGKQITWRDVDAQPSGDLLHQLAQSVGGALWSAATSSGDAYVWLEDINNRPSMRKLMQDPDLVIRIHLDSTIVDGTQAIEIDACDVLLEPVKWVQTTEDDSTRVVVTWQEQTLDTEGNPKPTSRDYIADNPNQEALTGRRRMQTTTQLANLSDAQLLADSLMARMSAPGWRIDGLIWDMELTDRLDAAALDKVMTILDGVKRLGLGILLTNVPEWAPPATGEDIWLFLEGATFFNQDGAWRLELLVSNGLAQGAATVRWDDLLGSITPAATRTNRATNPRAITGGTAQWGQAGWGTGGNGTTSYITAVTAPAGTNISTAFRKTWTTAATSATAAALALTGDASNRIPVTAGKTYTVSVFVRHNSIGTKNYEILLRWFNQVATSGSAQVGADQIGAAVAVADGVGWTRLSITVTAPAGALSMNIYPRLQLAATGTIPINATQDGTGLLIEEAGAVGAYFDGATVDAPPLDYAWSGTANASMSTATDTTTPVTGWQWDQFDPAITWNDLHGVGI